MHKTLYVCILIIIISIIMCFNDYLCYFILIDSVSLYIITKSYARYNVFKAALRFLHFSCFQRLYVCKSIFV